MKKMPRISESEWEVMKVVWSQSPTNASQIIKDLSPTTTWKPKTIMTLINRLVKKGALTRQGMRKATRYYLNLEKVD